MRQLDSVYPSSTSNDDTQHGLRVLRDLLVSMEVLETVEYDGVLSIQKVRNNLYLWTVRPGDLYARHYCTSLFRNKLYITRVY